MFTLKLKRADKKIKSYGKTTHLDLSNDNIIKISPHGALIKFTNLETLYLQRNKLTDISEICSLVTLEYLYLHNNKIKQIPSTIGTLVNLTYLDLSNNKILELPPEFNNLINLKKLFLYHNQITKIQNIKLLNLEILNLEYNNIKYLSFEPFKKALQEKIFDNTELILSNNKLKFLPLLSKNIDELYISNNQIIIYLTDNYISNKYNLIYNYDV